MVDERCRLAGWDLDDDFFVSVSSLAFFAAALVVVAFVAVELERDVELIVERLRVADSFEGSFTFDDDDGDADRYDRLVVVDDAGDEILSLI